LFFPAQIIIFACGHAASEQNSNPPEILVEARHLEQVENPGEIDRWRKVIDAQEVRAIGDAVTTYYRCTGCYSMVGDAINTTVPLKDAGNEHSGVIQAPVSYTVCRAYGKDQSLNCNGTLTGSYRTADDKNSGGHDGLHWYIVVPKPGVGHGRCWVDATIVVEFLYASPGNREKHNCGKTGTIAFHYGK
jgi:hypothetical protein